MLITAASIADACNSSVEGLNALVRRLSRRIDYATARRVTGTSVHDLIHPFGSWAIVTKQLRPYLERHVRYEVPDQVYGFVAGRSTRGNAAHHLAKECVLRVDLKNFFPSIGFRRVFETLAERGLTEEAARLVTDLCTLGGTLPIGLSTSPFLSNLVFASTDADLLDLANLRGLAHTRYVDDLIFSGVVDDSVYSAITEILSSHGWIINENKTAFMRRGGPQYVTGLYVGSADGPHVPRRLKRHMRWIVHMIERVGYETYMAQFGGDERNDYPKRLAGWAHYIASVEPRLGADLLKRLDRNTPESYWPAPDYEYDIDAYLDLHDVVSLDDLM